MMRVIYGWLFVDAGGPDSRRTSTASSDIMAGFPFGRPVSRRPSSTSARSSPETLGGTVDKRTASERTLGPIVKNVERVSMERVIEESNNGDNMEEDKENNNREQRDVSVKVDPSEVSTRTPELKHGDIPNKALPRPINRLRRHHELNGDALHIHLEDVIESDDESVRDTSSNPDISISSVVRRNSLTRQDSLTRDSLTRQDSVIIHEPYTTPHSKTPTPLVNTPTHSNTPTFANTPLHTNIPPYINTPTHANTPTHPITPPHENTPTHSSITSHASTPTHDNTPTHSNTSHYSNTPPQPNTPLHLNTSPQLNTHTSETSQLNMSSQSNTPTHIPTHQGTQQSNPSHYSPTPCHSQATVAALTPCTSRRHSDDGTSPVPPRTAVVTIDIPNGPVAIATSPLETNSDHITWYSRPKEETSGGQKSPSIGHTETIQDQSLMMSSSLTSLPSADNTSYPTTVVNLDQQAPSPHAESKQSW